MKDGRFSVIFEYGGDAPLRLDNLTMQKAKQRFDAFVNKPTEGVEAVLVLDHEEKLCIKWERGIGVIIHPALRS